MCGIAGAIRFSGLRAGERRLGAVMAATLRHRGPDGEGAWCDGVASLGHTRLSIVDLDAGHQPMGNEDGTVQVTFNGEIYNHRELAAELAAKGHRFRTRCDTEVLVHLYEEVGERFVERLNGMFAIGLWDARRRRLLLVRDRLGIKPLYYAVDGDRVLFGSELKALLAAGLDRRLDETALVDYLTFGHVPCPRTIFRGINKLEPGTLAIFNAGSVRMQRYWDIPVVDTDTADAFGDDEELDQHAGVFAALLEDAVRLRRVADVPLGAFLSGGIDSTAVVAAMSRAAAAPVLTHTIGFDRWDHDERDHARRAARRWDTDHRDHLVSADAAELLPKLVRCADEPFADSSLLPTYCLAEATRQRVTVALAGDGADEMLAGYRRYRFDLAESRLRRRLPAMLRRTAGVLGELYPKADWLPRPLRAKVTLENLACDDVTAHLRSVSMRCGTLPNLLLSPDVRSAACGHDPFARSRDLYARYPRAHPLDRLLYLDMKTLLPDDMLTKVDRASMAWGLEVREPLLDYRLVELATRMPPACKLHGATGKRVLRRVLRHWGDEPAGIQSKRGFTIPVDAWFRGPLRPMSIDLLTDSGSITRDWLEPRAVRALLREHDAGLRTNGHVLWMLVTLELWGRAFLRPQEHAGVRDTPPGCATTSHLGSVDTTQPAEVPA